MCAAVKAFSASACSASAALTFSASSLACASSAGRSSGDAAPTCLLAAFCSARRLSAADTAARRAASASSSASTRPGSSPRARCDARTTSGFSRSSLRSITAATLLSPESTRRPRQAQPHNVTSASLVTAPDTPVTMERMLDAPEREPIARRRGTNSPRPRVAWWQSLHATSTRRALLLTALGGLLIAGLITALPSRRRLQRADRQRDLARPPRQRHVRPRQERRLPELAGTHAGRGRDRRLQGRAPLRGRRVGGHAHLPRQRVRPRRRAAVAGPDPADQPGAVPGGRAAATSATEFDPNSRFTVSMLWSGDKAWRQSGERRMLCGLQLPGAEQPAAGVQGQGRRRRPVQGLARRHLPGHRPVHQPADRHSRRLRGAARHGGHRRGQPGREVPAGAAAGAGSGRVHQGRLHPDDRRLPGADPAAQHHADADLQHDLAAELVGGQPPGVVQHRRHPGQRRLVDAAQQRQGPAA